MCIVCMHTQDMGLYTSIRVCICIYIYMYAAYTVLIAVIRLHANAGYQQLETVVAGSSVAT